MLVPIGVGTSLSPYIQECKKIIEERNLTHKLESNGTAIKGDGKVVFKCVENAMQKAIKKGYSRIFSNIKLNTRIYKLQKFKHKINSV